MLLISPVNQEHLFFERIAGFWKVPCTTTLLFLCVDVPLHLPGWPARVIQFKAPDDPLDDTVLVIRIQALECGRSSGLVGVPSQKSVGESVKSPDPKIARRD